MSATKGTLAKQIVCFLRRERRPVTLKAGVSVDVRHDAEAQLWFLTVQLSEDESLTLTSVQEPKIR